MEADIFTNGHHDQAGATEAERLRAAEPATASELAGPAPEQAGPAPEPSGVAPEPTEPPHAPPEPSSEHAAEEDVLGEAAGELDAVEAALGRLEDGSFDRCEVCGGPIGQERLLQNPLLTRCPQHAGPG